MSLQVKQLYEFDRYRLDTARRALLSNGDPVPLTPKAFDTLLALVRHGGDVVGKDELLKEVWPDTFVEEATLTQNVSTLRKALGLDRSGKQFIETVPKYGYRFAAPVSARSISDNHVLPQTAAASHAVPPARAGFKRIPRAWFLILLLLLLVPAALITVKFYARSKTPYELEPPFQKIWLHDGSHLILERGVDINDVVLISNSL
jgi:DNA-binding winged helix-turn-helix (wHTH) protein